MTGIVEHAVAQSERSGYVPVNGMDLYYEIHGSGGVPLVLLHGAFSSIHNSFGELIDPLAAGRQIIAFDYQGHGRTADIDRPMSIEGIAGDIVAALAQLGIDRVDLLGYSTGGTVALRIAVDHPQLIRRLVVISTVYRKEGIRDGLMDGLAQMPPSAMYETPWYTNYMSLNPKPDFDTLFAKKAAMDANMQDFSNEEVRSIKAPMMIVAGDSDLPKLDHLVDLYRLVGGDRFGDSPEGLPASALAILPGTSHVTAPFQTGALMDAIPNFLDRPFISS